MPYRDTHPFPLAHMVYFALADRSKSTLKFFLDACTKYLSGHAGQTHFSLGLRAVEMQRDVNIKDFDVAMNMVFKDLDSYDKYRNDQRHQDFITATAGMTTIRRVFDSYLTGGKRESRQRTNGKKVRR